MITKINLVLKELEGFRKVPMPHKFTKGCLIKYVTLINNKPALKMGRFRRYENDNIWLYSDSRDWSVRTCYREPDGTINAAKTNNIHFHIEKQKPKANEGAQQNQSGGAPSKEKRVKELDEMIVYQQNILDKLAERMKIIEIDKARLVNERDDLEEMLRQNQMNFQSIVQRLKEAEAENIKYKEVIHNLIHSR